MNACNSFLDNGSDLCNKDNALPVDDGSESIDYTCNNEFMEEDGNYDGFLNGLAFHYKELEVALTSPINKYYCQGPSLCHGLAKKFSTVLECVFVCRDMDYIF